MTTLRRSHEAGFTLVEALVATVLMAFILAALATVTAQWMPNWKRGVARAQRTQLLAVGIERLVADLAAAQFISASGAAEAPLFEGGELSVTFVRTALGPNATPSLEVVKVAEVNDRLGPALVRTTAPFTPVPSGSNDSARFVFGNPVILVRPPYRVFFSFAGEDREWRDTWRGQPRLPRAARIRLRDGATSETLTVSTATLLHSEFPALWQRPSQALR